MSYPYRFHTFAVAAEEHAGDVIQIATDASLDEGDAIIRTITSPGLGSSGVEYCVQVGRNEIAVLVAAVEDALSGPSRHDEDEEHLKCLRTRLVRMAAALESEPKANHALGVTEEPYYSPSVTEEPRTILVHLNVSAHANDSRSAEEIITLVEGALDVGIEGNDDLANLTVDVALAEEI